MTRECMNPANDISRGAAVEDPSATCLDTLSPLLPLFPLSGPEHHGSMQSEWSESTSPSLADSLLSLDFDSADTMGTTLYNSDLLSDSSVSPVTTPKETTAFRLFAPVDAVMFPHQDTEQDAPSPKRVRMDAEMPAPSMFQSLPSVLRHDFTLFPGDDELHVPSKQDLDMTNPKAEKVMSLLDTLNGSPTQQPSVSTQLRSGSLDSALSEPKTAPPALMEKTPTSMPASVLPSPPITGLAVTPASISAPALSSTSMGGTKSFRGTRRRRRDVDELLPLDAPIQPRMYHTESATSRRDSKDHSSSGEVSPKNGNPLATPTLPSAENQDVDARALKRLSNTIAARRSRHRKAEELKRLYDMIEQLEKEVGVWKGRCEAAEQERDRLRTNSVALRM